MEGLYLSLFFPLNDRSQEQIIHLIWNLSSTDTGLGALNSVSFRGKAGTKLYP